MANKDRNKDLEFTLEQSNRSKEIAQKTTQQAVRVRLFDIGGIEQMPMQKHSPKPLIK